MVRRTTLYAVLVALLAAAISCAVAWPAQSATAPVRIMALGDSITAAPGCWRAILWHDLQTNGYTNNANGTVTGNWSGFCLVVANASSANGALVEPWTCDERSNQYRTLG